MLSVSKSGNYEFFVIFFFFYGEELLPLRPSPKLEDHPLSAVRGCLFDMFAAAVHIGGRCIIRNLRTRRAMVTRTVTRVAVVSGVARFLLAPVARNQSGHQ
jgi:hypothetical protein